MKIIYLYPNSSYKNPLRSDSLFGLISWGFRQIYGNADLEEILEGFKNGEPPFLLSSSFPFTLNNTTLTRFFPKPVQKPVIVERSPEKMSLYKKYKKTAWITESIFKDICCNKLSDQEFFNKELWTTYEHKTHQIMHNNIARISGASKNLFYTEEYFPGSGGLFFLIDYIDKAFEQKMKGVFQFFEHTGFGGDASTGKGSFRFEIEDYNHLSPISGANANTNLSLYWPDNSECIFYKQYPESVWYRLAHRKGKVGGKLYTTGNVWKNGVNTFTEGSIFPKMNNRSTYGGFPVVKKKGGDLPFDVYYYGYALMVDFLLKER